MTLIQIVLTIAVVGFLVYLLTTYVPMAAPFKDVIIAIAVIGLVAWVVANWRRIAFAFVVVLATMLHE